MPTGYTCKVEDGTMTDVKEYILNCARQFGGLMHMRDDDNFSKIRYKIVDDYNLKQLKRTFDKFKEFMKLTDDEIQNKIDERKQTNRKDNAEYLERLEQKKQRI